MKEKIVSHEISKLSYKLGCLNLDCYSCLVFDTNQNKEIEVFYNDVEPIHKNFKFLGLLPTQSLLQKWIRENFLIFIEIQTDLTNEPKFYPMACRFHKDGEYYNGVENNIINKNGFLYYSYEEALDVALLEVLNYLNKNQS